MSERKINFPSINHVWEEVKKQKEKSVRKDEKSRHDLQLWDTLIVESPFFFLFFRRRSSKVRVLCFYPVDIMYTCTNTKENPRANPNAVLNQGTVCSASACAITINFDNLAKEYSHILTVYIRIINVYTEVEI